MNGRKTEYKRKKNPADDIKKDVGNEGHRCGQKGRKTNRCKKRIRERQTHVKKDVEKDRQTEGRQTEVKADGEEDKQI